MIQDKDHKQTAENPGGNEKEPAVPISQDTEAQTSPDEEAALEQQRKEAERERD